MNEKGFYSNYTNVTFLDKIISSLNSCSSFSWSVSFIKKAGLDLLLPALEDALKRGAKGELVTSTYQNFTDVPSLEVFFSLQAKYSNFSCHVDFDSFGDDGFHTKGYIFSYPDHHEIIIGSSNITYWALMKNMEWDLSVISKDQEPLLDSINKEYVHYWKKTEPLTRDLIRRYTIHLSYAIQSWDMDYFDPENSRSIHPNLMQRQALRQISRYRLMGVKKALVVAATGSGKTYLAAFDALNFQAKKILFVVHKDMILGKALEKFAAVFGKTKTYGIYTGESKELDADFLFASNQILARHLELFAPDEFDYIVVDEVHHATASTYKKIISYFKPQFLLGLTATPDRMDEQSVYDLFDKNVPYDLRLRDALENDLIVPFHYFGIKDSLIDYEDDVTQEGIRRIVMACSSQDNCKYIAEQIEKHKQSGGKLKCVAFCRNIEHCRLMADGMNEIGYPSVSLTGRNSTGERIKAFNDLQDEDNPLEIVFCVDILNEGIDIPSMNMVLFLRPTESSTIFIQQLGRGLRKYEGKQYLTVLDFIGNSYTRSVQIAIALGSLSKGGSPDKRTMLDHVRTNFDTLEIPGVEVHFDRESQDEILASIEKTNFNTFDLLLQDYKNFKSYLKLGPAEYPKHIDFLNPEVGADLLRYTKKFESYYDFLARANEEIPYFNDEEKNAIRTLSWFLPLVRPYEFAIVQSLLAGSKSSVALKKELSNNDNFNEDSYNHALLMLQDKISYNHTEHHIVLLGLKDDVYFLLFSTNNPVFVDWIKDLLNYGLERYVGEFLHVTTPLRIYGGYTMATSLLAINNNSLYNMTGVTYTQGHLLLYINLNKDFQAEERLKYKDKFLSNKVLQWESQTGTTLTNGKGVRLIKQGKADIFVRKTKKEDGIESPFVYLGEGTLTNPRDSGNSAKALLFDIVLDKEVPEEYKYDFGIEDAEFKNA